MPLMDFNTPLGLKPHKMKYSKSLVHSSVMLQRICLTAVAVSFANASLRHNAWLLRVFSTKISPGENIEKKVIYLCLSEERSVEIYRKVPEMRCEVCDSSKPPSIVSTTFAISVA